MCSLGVLHGRERLVWTKKVTTTSTLLLCVPIAARRRGGDFNLKTCKSCKLVRYYSATCQKNQWSTHKKLCKQRAAKLHDEVLFKEPPAKEDCPICFLPMPINLISCVSIQDATISSVPIYNFVIALLQKEYLYWVHTLLL